jgi:uncharacterized membrane protein
MNTTVDTTLLRPPHVEVQSVAVFRPLTWLGRGATDLVRCWPANVAHGLLMAALGWVLVLMLGNHPYFVAAAASGFLLLAPIMTTGLCELSRRREAREPVTFDASLEVIAVNWNALFRFGCVLAAFAVVWFALSEVLLKAVFNVPAPDVAETFWRGFLDTSNRDQLVSYIATGGVLACLVFLLSVVTVPLVIDRRASASEAMRVSVRVVAANPLAMLLWAALIVTLMTIGFGTLLFGMIILIPVVGHGTWHAYRDLVRH